MRVVPSDVMVMTFQQERWGGGGPGQITMLAEKRGTAQKTLQKRKTKRWTGGRMHENNRKIAISVALYHHTAEHLYNPCRYIKLHTNTMRLSK